MRLRWLIGLTLLACGCGLGDYEARMHDAQQRQIRWDEEARLLAEPIQIPSTTNKEGTKYPLANVFLRPPRGIGPQTSNEKNPRGDLLYTYHPTRDKGAEPFAFVELAFGGDGKEFASDVLKILPVPLNTQARTRQMRAFGRQTTTTFETTEFEDDKYFLSVNIWRGDSRQVAIVYYVTKANRSSAGRALDLSLESFGAEAEANQRRDVFARGSPLGKVQ